MAPLVEAENSQVRLDCEPREWGSTLDVGRETPGRERLTRTTLRAEQVVGLRAFPNAMTSDE